MEWILFLVQTNSFISLMLTVQEMSIRKKLYFTQKNPQFFQCITVNIICLLLKYLIGSGTVFHCSCTLFPVSVLKGELTIFFMY